MDQSLRSAFDQVDRTADPADFVRYLDTDLALVESAFDLRASTQRAVDAGVITQQRATDWLASLAAARAVGEFFCAVGGVLAFGRKPRS